MHYYQFNIKDYAVSTRHLSNEEDLCYRRLLDLYYSDEQPLSLAIATLERRLQISAETIKSVLSEFFTETEKGWINQRADEEIQIANEKAERLRANGKRGGKATARQRLREAQARLKPGSSHAQASASTHNPLPIYTPIVPKGTSPEISDSLSRARMLFRMQPSTPLDSAQIRSWKKNKGVVEATSEEQWLLLEWYYSQGTGKGEPGEYRRRDLSTLLNNWNGELGRAAEEAHLRGVSLFKKNKKAEEVEPKGWRKALCEVFDETTEEAASGAEWSKLSQEVKQAILARLEGGAA